MKPTADAKSLHILQHALGLDDHGRTSGGAPAAPWARAREVKT